MPEQETRDAVGSTRAETTIAELSPSDYGPSEPRSLLFLSCDLVGSTRFKQAQANAARARAAQATEQPASRAPDPAWQMTFLAFYREFPQTLGGLVEEAGFEPGFILWKAVGDELIFTVHVRDEDEIFRAVRLWLDAMRKYEIDSLADTPLSTKGGAFVATFPGPDSESSIPRNPASETSDKGFVELNDEALSVRGTAAGDAYLYDYFGPSIDTGFRVIGACDNRFFTLANEVAWAMAQCSDDAGADKKKYPLDDLRLLATPQFKGVWDGRNYPLFALDRHNEDHINVALADIQQTTIDPSKVVNLCQACAAEPSWPSKLFLPRSEKGFFKQAPVDSLDAHRANSMDGAETIAVEPPETTDVLEQNPPLPDPVVKA